MADIKVIYKNAEGFDNEHSESADSVKMLSFKTATKELTDAKLATLIDGADNADGHTHDGRYFTESEHISSSAGIGDSGKPIILNASGKVDGSFIDLGSIQHDSLAGLGDDDHTQYILATGTRDLSGVQKYASLVSISDDKDLTHKKYVDDAIVAAELGNEWAESVLTRTITPPGSPSTGDRILIDGVLGTATGAFAGHEDSIAQYDGAAWIFNSPSVGTFVSVDDEDTRIYYYGGLSWSFKSFESTTASTGLTKVGMDIRLDSSSAGDGLGFSSGVLSVNVTGALEISADSLQVKADGINDLHIDWGTGTNQVSAVDLPIADANSVITATEVEGALQELAQADIGVVFVAAEALTKGDLVYVSANNTVSKLSTLSSNAECVGVVSNSGAILGGNVRVKRVSRVLTSVLSGATAGTTYYWSGSALSASAPSASGSNVWKIGVSKNATDLMLNVEHVKKNA